MIRVNGTEFRQPERPVVVVCIDGSDPAYHARGLADGILPNMARFVESGFSATADGVVPSFTNPNNLSIVTAAPPAVHGIAGNFFLDPETGAEVMMNDPALLRAESLLAAFSRDGARVVVITAKDKLRRLLGHGIRGGICFSSEMAAGCTMDEHGIEDVLDLVGAPEPDVYSAELSLFVMAAGIRILERDRPDIMYLSLTDYIQHKHAPGTPESDAFYGALDDAAGRLADLGAIVALTADHGMSDKSAADGAPNVVYLQSALDEAIGPGAARVILPITDPYVVHHGALGGFARVHCTGANPVAVMDIARALPGIEAVFDRAGAARTFELPPDIEGDVAVIADAATVIGTSEERHDLAALDGHRLRSHGGIAERRVPFVLSTPLNEAYAARAATGGLRNYDIFDFAINGTA
jgi:phosphonoacetate hydrolase